MPVRDWLKELPQTVFLCAAMVCKGIFVVKGLPLYVFVYALSNEHSSKSVL